MANFSEMNDYELAFTLDQWQGDALLAWDKFTENEKKYLSALEKEACRRFIENNLDEFID